MICAIHQPNYWPWLGYFDKMRQADLFVLLDAVPFSRQSYTQRTRVFLPKQGRETWLTVPVKATLGMPINEVIVGPGTWARKHAETLRQTYAKCQGFAEVWPLVEAVYCGIPAHLADLNLRAIETTRELLGIATPMVKQGELAGCTGTGSELLASICAAVGANEYLSGPSGAGYMNLDDFAARGIVVRFHHFEEPASRVRGLSALHALFHDGKRAAA